MAANAHENVAAGTPALLYVAPLSAATPTPMDLLNPPTEISGWENSSVGLTGGPATWRDSRTHNPVRAEQFALPIDYRLGEATYEIDVQVLETAKIDVLRKIWGLPTSAVTTQAAQVGQPGYTTLDVLYRNTDPVQVILAYTGVDGFPVWTYIPRAKFIQATTEGELGRNSTAIPTVTISALQPTDGSPAVQILRQDAEPLSGGES